jgi:phospholipase/lecithinase/hemolysin
MPVYRPLLAAALAALTQAPAAAGPITGVVSFGDSLTDTGNAFIGTGGAIPPSPPYFAGRFSNGPVWVEYLAGRLGVPAPAPFLAGGTNYAVGGAESGGGFSPLGAPNLLTQVALYLGAGHVPAPDTLFTVWVGANDFLNAGQTNPAVPVSNVSTAIGTLAAAGATRFLVPNLPDLGDIPGSLPLPPEARAALNALSAEYNEGLLFELGMLELVLGVEIDLLDVAGVYRAVRADPAAYGFTNVTTAALDDGVLDGAGYLFWDDLHPTTAGHLLLGDRAFAAVVPEPATVALAGVGGVGLLAARRRKSAVTAG